MTVVRYFPAPRENGQGVSPETLVADGINGSFGRSMGLYPLFVSLEEAHKNMIDPEGYKGTFVKVTFEEVSADG